MDKACEWTPDKIAELTQFLKVLDGTKIVVYVIAFIAVALFFERVAFKIIEWRSGDRSNKLIEDCREVLGAVKSALERLD